MTKKYMPYEKKRKLQEVGWPVAVTNEFGDVNDKIFDCLLRIKVGNLAGPHFSTERMLENILPLGIKLIDKIRNIANPRLWHDNAECFDHFAFDVDGDHYDIRSYKAFAIIKNHVAETSNMRVFNDGASHETIIRWFDNGNHLRWKVPKSPGPQDCMNALLAAYTDNAESIYDDKAKCPQVWDRNGTYFIGIMDETAKWTFSIAWSEARAAYVLQNSSNEVLATAEQFYTIFDYAMQAWEWK